MDEDPCSARLLCVLHPDGLSCPRCGSGRFGVHRKHRAPILDHRCRDSRAVFNAFTGTALRGTNRRPSALVLILRGFAQGVPTAELKCDRVELLGLRHKVQGHATAGLDPEPLPDPVTEADECYLNAGKKSGPHPLSDDPPRRRANKRRGHGTFQNDRPSVAGVVGRGSCRARLRVIRNADRRTLEALVQGGTVPGAVVNTDEWRADAYLPELGRGHVTVNHGAKGWARDADGDGVREVHTNAMEGWWPGLRNFLRPFRGVSKWHLAEYVAMFV